MQIAILTTETSHHNYFVRELAATGLELSVFVETKPVIAPFDTYHEFEDARDEYEWNTFFPTGRKALTELAPTSVFHDINDPAVVRSLREDRPDAIIVYGTGIIRAEIIAVTPGRIVNLHGADPREYRGLDSALWAIYHRDFGGLAVTLHRLNAALDDGEIVATTPVPIATGLNLHQLRAEYARSCVELTLEGIEQLRTKGGFRSTPQERAGRYYSFMPGVMKEAVRQVFERHTQGVRTM